MLRINKLNIIKLNHSYKIINLRHSYITPIKKNVKPVRINSNLWDRLKTTFSGRKVSFQLTTGGEYQSSPRFFMPFLILFGINVFIFLLINLQDPRYSKRWVYDHFTVSLENLYKHRYYTLITSSFTHQSLLHLGLNMFMLYQGCELLRYGLANPAKTVYLLYFLGALGSSALYLFQQKFITKSRFNRCYGASGSVAAILGTTFMLFPNLPLALYFIIPIPAGVALWSFVTISAIFTFLPSGGGNNIAHSAHLGGALTGILFFIFKIRL